VIPSVPEVHRPVLVPEQRVNRLPGLPLELRERRGPYELVLHRGERDPHADHAPDLRPPDPGAAYDDLGFDAPPRGLDRAYPATLDVDARDLRLAVEPGAAVHGHPGHRLASPELPGDAVGGHEEPP
jgi:hypothetical protein